MIKPYEIYCDYDGVLVDLQKGMRNAIGKSYDPDEWHKAGEEKREIIRQHPYFWRDLPPMEDFSTLWSFIGPLRANILTAYAEWDKEECVEEKWLWNLKYTKVPANRFFCVGRAEKQLFAVSPEGKPNVLIDDYSLNIQEWRKAGGIGVMHHDAASTVMKLKNLGFYIDEFNSKLYGNYQTS
jgi:5'-nucleotidase